DAVGPRREFARRFTEEIGKFTRNTLGDRWKKAIGFVTRMPEAAGLSGNSDDVVGHRQEFARRFVEGIGKLAGRSPEEDHRTRRKNAGGYQIK
ncbi:hypothetical protein BHM03_00033596, partial [Ensete ventricosum]